MDKAYEPREIEAKWYAFWEGRNCFAPAATPAAGAAPYCILISTVKWWPPLPCAAAAARAASHRRESDVASASDGCAVTVFDDTP